MVQPHRYTRLANLFEEFCTCFNDADAVIVADVYPAGEAPIAGIDSDALVEGLIARGHRRVHRAARARRLAALIRETAPAGRHGGVPGRRQHHQLGQCAAAPAGRRWPRAACRGGRAPRWRPLLDLIDRLPAVRGRSTAGAPLAPLTWFRVGGPAEILFRPADADDLAAFLAAGPADVPVTVIGVGSNLLVRDGGVRAW